MTLTLTQKKVNRNTLFVKELRYYKILIVRLLRYYKVDYL